VHVRKIQGREGKESEDTARCTYVRGCVNVDGMRRVRTPYAAYRVNTWLALTTCARGYVSVMGKVILCGA